MSLYRFLPLLLLLPTATFLPATARAQAERPSAMKLFPAETVLWVRTAEAGLLVERFRQTAVAQAALDPEMADLTGRLTGLVQENPAYQYFESVIDADVQDLLRLPQGEIAFGVVKRPNSDPGLLLLADFGDQAQLAQEVFEDLQELAQDSTELTVATEALRSDEATVIRDGNNQDTTVAVVRRDTTFIACNDRDLLQSVLDRWDGIPIEPPLDAAEGEDAEEPAEPLYAEPLAANPSFSATLRELTPGNEEPPQLLFFVDPIGMIEAIGGRQTGVRIAMATFPALGVDGIKGLGAAMWFATDKWDSLTRGHLLLDNPRAGVVKIARLETGELVPPDCVPAAMENCFSVRVDPPRLLDDIAAMYDKFQYEGAFRKRNIAALTEAYGFDFEEEFVGNLDGSLFYISGYDESGRGIGAQPALVLGVNDPEAAKESLSKLVEKYSDKFEDHAFGAFEYYTFVPDFFREMPREERPFSPSLAILGDHLVLSQTEAWIKQIIEAHDDQRPRLNDSLQYRLVKSRLERFTGGQPFSGVAYHDTEPMIRYFYQMASGVEEEEEDPEDRRVRRPRFFTNLRQIIRDSELPPVETLLKYNTPSGSVMIDTTTGWHMISFSFKRRVE